MKINSIYYHPSFKKAFLGLPSSLRRKAIKKEKIFFKNPFDQRLKTHKLHGRLKNQCSFSVDKKNRIIFIFDNKDVIFLDVGDHDIYN